jgi:nucleoid DNA-binding protein
MNKSDLVKVVQEVVCSKREAEDAVGAVIESITSALKKGEQVSLVGFGTFTVANRKARTARNIRTGETINVAAKRVPKFTPGKALKEAVQ